MTDIKLSCYIVQKETISLCVKKRAKSPVRMLSTKCVNKSYMSLIYMYKDYLALNNLQWLICHITQPNQIICI